VAYGLCYGLFLSGQRGMEYNSDRVI